MWLWVFVFAGIAIAGLIVMISYGVWLAHKAADVMSEFTVLGERTGKIMELLGQIHAPDLDRPVRYGDAHVVAERHDEFV